MIPVFSSQLTFSNIAQVLDNCYRATYNTGMNESNETNLQNHEMLVKSLGRAGHQVNNQLDAALAPYGLSLAKLGLLRILVLAAAPVPLSQLADSLSCVKSNITQLVDRLNADGLVERQENPDDRRSKCASVTEAGRWLYFVGEGVERKVEQELFGEFSAEERQQLSMTLKRLSPGQVSAT